MSNLSDIGFPTPDEEAVNEMVIHVLEVATPQQNPYGFYLVFSDPSGAEIWMQGNFDQELVGFNPHFAGSSALEVEIIERLERDSSEFDGGFRASAGGTEFVFDVPDFREVSDAEVPRRATVQLTAFASNDFAAGSASSDGFESVPPPDPEMQPRPVARIAGPIAGFEKRKNELSGEEFYWLRVTTPVGEIDVVSDPKWLAAEPSVGDRVSGTFWLSGRLQRSMDNDQWTMDN